MDTLTWLNVAGAFLMLICLVVWGQRYAEKPTNANLTGVWISAGLLIFNALAAMR